jgi:DinB superfamily
MYNSPKDLLDALRATPDTLTGLLAVVTQEQARQARGGDEGWSIVEVLCHLRDADEITTQRLVKMRDLDNPDILSYDQEKLAIERNYAAQDLLAALAGFIAERQRHIAVLESLSPEGWERPGNHGEIGTITILTLTIHNVSHDAIHCAQIARQLKVN